MKNLFIGIDVSKDFFDYCFLTKENKILYKGQNPNTKEGITHFCKKVNSFKDYKPWICMEHTGCYGYLLAYEFSERSICFSLLVPFDLKHSMGLVRGKNDRIDAYRIASYAVSNEHKLKPYKLPIEELRSLKVLMKTRDRYAKVLVQLKNGLKGIKITGKTIDLDELVKGEEATIEVMKQKIKGLEKQMNQIVKSIEELNKTYKKITSVVGVGPITAIKCIVETSNFTKFTDPRKFNCHCGLAPFEYSSGSSIKWKTHTSPLCNKTLKGLLYKAACSAIQHDPQLKRYYNRKIEEGKHKLCVINAVANKIVLRIFAVEKRETAYVKLAA